MFPGKENNLMLYSKKSTIKNKNFNKNKKDKFLLKLNQSHWKISEFLSSHKITCQYKVFAFSGQAQSQGYFTADQWRQIGRKVIDKNNFDAIIPQNYCKTKYFQNQIQLTDEYYVDGEIWKYYSIGQTKLIKVKSLCATPTKEMSATSQCPDISNGKVSLIKTRTTYYNSYFIPDNFSIDKVPDEYKQYFDAICKFINIVRYRHFKEHLSKNQFVNLNYNNLLNSLGKCKLTRKNIFPIIRKWLLENIVERDGRYQIDVKSYGYRFREGYKGGKFSLIKTRTRFKPLYNQPKLPLHIKLLEDMKRIKINENYKNEQINNEDTKKLYNQVAEDIKDQNYWIKWEGEKGGRLYSTFTNCPSPLRKYFEVDKTKLIQLDIGNCHPLLYSMHLKKTGIIDEKYNNAVETNQFYNLFKKYNIKDIKLEIRRLFYGSNKLRTSIRQPFKMEFPEVYADMFEYKKKNSFASFLQLIEKRFVLDNCVRQMQLKGIFCITIHDAFLIKPEDQARATEIIQSEAMKLNIKIPLTIKE